MVDRQHDRYCMEVLEMTIGPATILAIIAALLATLLWALCNWRPTFWPALGMFLFGAALVLVMLAGPLIKLP
mgnify:CR=1 FL=1